MARGEDTSNHPMRRVDRPSFQVGISDYEQAPIQRKATRIMEGRGLTTVFGTTRYGPVTLRDDKARGRTAGSYRR